MKNKKTWIIGIALIVLVGLLVGIYFATRPQTTAGQKEFTLVVVHGNGEEKTFTVQTDAEYVGAALQEQGLIVGTEGPYGLYIDGVDGETAVYEEDGAYWAFYEGEEYAMQGIDLTPIVPGTVYKLVYTLAEQ